MAKEKTKAKATDTKKRAKKPSATEMAKEEVMEVTEVQEVEAEKVEEETKTEEMETVSVSHTEASEPIMEEAVSNEEETEKGAPIVSQEEIESVVDESKGIVEQDYKKISGKRASSNIDLMFGFTWNGQAMD